ncbi:unnamed protein product, partial [Brachionus calyciflorus]
MRFIITKLIQIKKYWLIDERKKDGFSALHLACLNNHYDLVRVLIENGNLNINIKNDAEQTPLHLAVDRLNYDIVKLLCTFKYPTDNKNRCNLNAQNKDGDSPLHCLLRNFSLCQLKLSNETNLIIISENRQMYQKIAYLLIENGSNIFLKNKNQQIPFDYCYDFEVVKSLFKFSNSLNRKFEHFFIVDEPAENRIIEFCKDDYNMCVICMKKKRDVLLKPCNHILVCNSCSINCIKCFLCDCFIKEIVRIEKCVLCNERGSVYLFEPCGHLITCSKCATSLKYCFKCKRLIERLVSYTEICLIKHDSANKQTILDLKRYMIKIKELNLIKQNAICGICNCSIRNLIFPCGHSFCKNC